MLYLGMWEKNVNMGILNKICNTGDVSTLQTAMTTWTAYNYIPSDMRFPWLHMPEGSVSRDTAYQLFFP